MNRSSSPFAETKRETPLLEGDSLTFFFYWLETRIRSIRYCSFEAEHQKVGVCVFRVNKSESKKISNVVRFEQEINRKGGGYAEV